MNTLSFKELEGSVSKRGSLIGFCFFSRELKQLRRRRLRKRHLKSELALLETLSRLFHLIKFVKWWQNFLELNSKRLYQSSGKENESCCLVFPSSTKPEIRHFHVVVVQWRQTNVQKRVMCVQSCCFVNLNVLVFCRSRFRRRRRCLSSLLNSLKYFVSPLLSFVK